MSDEVDKPAWDDRLSSEDIIALQKENAELRELAEKPALHRDLATFWQDEHKAAQLEISRLKSALEKALDRNREIDVAMCHEVALAQEVWRHQKSELEIALNLNSSKPTGGEK